MRIIKKTNKVVRANLLETEFNCVRVELAFLALTDGSLRFVGDFMFGFGSFQLDSPVALFKQYSVLLFFDTCLTQFGGKELSDIFALTNFLFRGQDRTYQLYREFKLECYCKECCANTFFGLFEENQSFIQLLLFSLCEFSKQIRIMCQKCTLSASPLK